MSKPKTQRVKWYIPEPHRIEVAAGWDYGDRLSMCCDLNGTIGISIVDNGCLGDLLWFVEEDQGIPGVRILAHGNASSLQQAKRISLKEARWFEAQRRKHTK